MQLEESQPMENEEAQEAVVEISVTPSVTKLQVDQAYTKWKDQGISHYSMNVQHMQSIWHFQIYQIEVIDGEISHTATCTPAPSEGGKCTVQEYDPTDYTVEGLFDTAYRLIESENENWVRIEFNPDYWYPEAIVFDHPDILDEDNVWRVVTFEAMP